MIEVHVAVLGGGPGGYTVAIHTAQLGARVACIKREPELGGTCPRIGCIPTKAWVQTAFAVKQAEERGWAAGKRWSCAALRAGPAPGWPIAAPAEGLND